MVPQRDTHALRSPWNIKLNRFQLTSTCRDAPKWLRRASKTRRRLPVFASVFGKSTSKSGARVSCSYIYMRIYLVSVYAVDLRRARVVYIYNSPCQRHAKPLTQCFDLSPTQTRLSTFYPNHMHGTQTRRTFTLYSHTYRTSTHHPLSAHPSATAVCAQFGRVKCKYPHSRVDCARRERLMAPEISRAYSF